MTATTERMDASAVEPLAARLADAAATGTSAEPPTAGYPTLDVETAYTVQDRVVAARVDAGHPIVGVKLGLTSEAKQRQMNVAEPIYGWLTADMRVDVGAPVLCAHYGQPRVEPEIAFLLGRDLSGPGVGAAEVLAATDAVTIAVDVLDSRYAGYKFTLPDVVADNASSALYLTGSIGVPPEDLDLGLEACLVEVNGIVVDSATGAAVQGHPAEALALAANALAERGIAIEPGWIVLTGGMTDAVPVGPETVVRVHFSHLGSLVVHGGK